MADSQHGRRGMCLTRSLRVSLIIPTLNEEEAIRKVLENLPNGWIDEVIVVDGSADDTPIIARNLV